MPGRTASHFTLIPLDNYNNGENPQAERPAGFRCLYIFSPSQYVYLQHPVHRQAGKIAVRIGS